MFFRESCFKQSGDKQRKSNPTHYRNPRKYFATWEATEIEQADGRFAHYELVSCKCVDTYVRLKGNQNQICWKWRKVGALLFVWHFPACMGMNVRLHGQCSHMRFCPACI